MPNHLPLAHDPSCSRGFAFQRDSEVRTCPVTVGVEKACEIMPVLAFGLRQPAT